MNKREVGKPDTDKTHPTSIPGWNGTNEELGEAIARMRYDKLLEVLSGCGKEISRQGIKDEERGRVQLAALLNAAARRIKRLCKVIEKVFALCEPYMQHEFEAERKSKD